MRVVSMGLRVAAAVSLAALAGCDPFKAEPEPSGALRGFGRTETAYAECGGVSVTRVRAATPEQARMVLGKFRLDLSKADGFATDGRFLSANGAHFALAADGCDALICSSLDASALAQAAERFGLEGKLAADAECPGWMDRFGWGVYGVGGLDNYLDWMGKGGAKPGERLDPREDLAFLREMGPLVFDNWLELEGASGADGILCANGFWSKNAWADAHGNPRGYRFYLPNSGSSWFSDRFPEFDDHRPDWANCGWMRYWWPVYHLSWHQDEAWMLFGEKAKETMEKVRGPNVRSWMMPLGELDHIQWYEMHADYSPASRASWRRFLRAQGVEEDIPQPEFATFEGLGGMVQDLAGDWTTSTDGTNSLTIRMPGNLGFTGLYKLAWDQMSKPEAERRYARAFSWDPACAGGKRVYFYFFPISPGGARHDIRLNGELVGQIGHWGALDVTSALKAGENQVEITLRDYHWKGRVFLSTEPPDAYPFADSAKNRLWRLWRDWKRDSQARQSGVLADAMRQADPETPIKFMAPYGLGMPNALRFMRDWGTYLHNTGEGMWFYPWYKRYGKVWDIPASSELGSPYDDVAAGQRAALRVFLAGLDSHEPVFHLQSYSRNPPVRAWWLEHKELFGRLGTFDIFGPQVLIFRRSALAEDEFPEPFPYPAAERRQIGSPWNWDLGRGSLQSLGVSMLYLDTDGLAAGKADGHRVMFDCGNEIVLEEEVASIAKWVERGGVFVAWPLSGRHSTDVCDAQPMSALTGVRTTRRPIGGKVKFAADTRYFPWLAGKTFADGGESIVWTGANANEWSCALELQPGADVEVAARFADGQPAVAVRRLGKGLVFTFGSAFFREARDREGIWWPGERERAFLREFLASVGFEKPVCETSDALVWAQPYRSNNGLDDVAVLCNFDAEGVQRVKTAWRVAAKPRAVSACLGGGVVHPKWEWADGVLTLELDLPAQEVAVLSAAAYAPGEAVRYWWGRERARWRELKRPELDFSPYTRGRWADPTQDLKPGARFAAGAAPEGWLEPGFDDSAWTPCAVDALQFWGLPDGSRACVRRTFDLDHPEWLGRGLTRLFVGSPGGPNFLSPGRVYLNGRELASSRASHGRREFDVSGLLKEKGNVLAFDFDPPEDGKFTGLYGSVHLHHVEAQEVRPRAGVGNLLEKIRAGREISVVYFGGSITSMDGWRNRTTDWLRQRYPGVVFHEKNASIGGTGSDLGAFRLAQDALAAKPDLLFVEFATNDHGSDLGAVRRQIEGIVRQTWAADPSTDIVFAYTITNAMTDDYLHGRYSRAAAEMEALADQYGIPSVCFGPRVAEELASGRMAISADEAKKAGEGVKAFAGDGVHPTEYGHGFYVESMKRAFEAMENLPPADHAKRLRTRCSDRANLERAKMLEIEPQMLEGVWEKLPESDEKSRSFSERMGQLWRTETPGAKLRFRFRGTRCALYDVLGPDGGKLHVRVDGKETRVVARFDGFCTYWRSGMLDIYDGADGEHEVELELDAAQPDRHEVSWSMKDPERELKDPKYNGTRFWPAKILVNGDLVR